MRFSAYLALDEGALPFIWNDPWQSVRYGGASAEEPRTILVHGDALPPPPSIASLQCRARAHVGSGHHHDTDGMAGLVNIFQPLLARIGEGLGYNAGQIVVSHGGKNTMHAAAVLMSAPNRQPDNIYGTGNLPLLTPSGNLFGSFH